MSMRVLLRIVLLTLKYIKSKNLETRLNDILVIFKELLPDSEDVQFWKVLASYVDNAARPDIRRQCARKIIEWFESGDQDRMHANGMSVEKIHENTGLSKRRIIQLKKILRKMASRIFPTFLMN
jgi:hypothetical protein